MIATFTEAVSPDPEPIIAGNPPATSDQKSQSPVTRQGSAGMFMKRKVSEVHYLRNSMNFTNMSIKGQGFIKKDNLMSPTGGETKPNKGNTRNNYGMRNSTSFVVTTNPSVAKNVANYNKMSESGSKEK